MTGEMSGGLCCEEDEMGGEMLDGPASTVDDRSSSPGGPRMEESSLSNGCSSLLSLLFCLGVELGASVQRWAMSRLMLTVSQSLQPDIAIRACSTYHLSHGLFSVHVMCDLIMPVSVSLFWP